MTSFDKLKKEIDALIPSTSHFETIEKESIENGDLDQLEIEKEDQKEELEPISKKQKTIIDDTRFEKLYDLLEVLKKSKKKKKREKIMLFYYFIYLF